MASVLCFPFGPVLSALGVRTVHYFSLDVESFEMDVLRAIPFHSVDIKVRLLGFLPFSLFYVSSSFIMF